MSAPTALHGGTAPLAAITSVFTPPCPTSWLLTTTKLPSQYPAFPTVGPSSCDPPSWRTNIAKAGFLYYSPAICPRGFVVGPNCGVTKTRTDEGFPAIAPGETVAYCVPVGLTCTTDITDFRGGVWGFARDATGAGALVTVGPAIQIRWVAADLTMLETHPLTPGLKLARTGTDTKPSSTSLATSTTKAPETRPTSGSEESSATVITDTKTGTPEFTLIFETPTSTPSPSNTASGNSNGSGGIGSLDRTTSIVVIVLVTVFAGIAVWVGAFFLFRRYKKRREREGSHLRKGSAETGLEQGAWDTRASSRAPESLVSPMSELESGPPAIGSTPNPAELEGDDLAPPSARGWLYRGSRFKSAHLQPPPYSPRSVITGSTRRTVRESFGEKVNDPAAALGRLRIPNPLSMGRPSPGSASPGTGSFWRLPRTPRTPNKSPSGAGRLSAQLPKPSPRSAMSGNGSRPSAIGRPERHDGAKDTQRDAIP